MKASKLAAIIDSFCLDEKKQFQKYIESPFFNTNDTLIHLWNILPTKFSAKQDEINGVRIWKKLRMQTVYTDDALRKLLSKLNQLAEDFIAYQEYNNEAGKHVFFLQACHKRKLSKHFVAANRQTNDIVKHDDYYNRLCGDYYKDACQKEQGEQRTHIISAMDNLDNFYIQKKLHIYTVHFSTRYSQKTPYKNISFKKFVAYAAEKIEANIMFQFYHCMASMFSHEKTDKLDQLWQFLDKSNEQKLTHHQRKTIYKGIQAQLTLKYNTQGKLEDAKELAALYEMLEKKDYLLVANKEKTKKSLTILRYKQAIITNIRAGNVRIDWAYEFMLRNKSFVNPIHQEGIYCYCLAYYHFAKKQYLSSLKCIAQIDEQNIEINKDSLYYLMHHHFLALQNYYELEDFDNLLSGITNFRKILNENTDIPHKTTRAYLNAVSMLNNILKLRQGNQKQGNVFYKKIEDTKDFYRRNWLLEKLKLKLLKKIEKDRKNKSSLIVQTNNISRK
ncbi:MAG: hypothetical protein ACPG5B_03115 [Chitinophagales bacterium]